MSISKVTPIIKSGKVRQCKQLSSHVHPSCILRNRKQYISSQDVSENCLDIICGVPQGYILGQLFFLIYVNDLFKVSNSLMEVMVADDTNLFLSHKNIDTFFASMNVELQNVSTWFK